MRAAGFVPAAWQSVGGTYLTAKAELEHDGLNHVAQCSSMGAPLREPVHQLRVAQEVVCTSAPAGKQIVRPDFPCEWFWTRATRAGVQPRDPRKLVVKRQLAQ